MATIFHITTVDEWDEAGKKGYYETASLKEEGFIHCCQEEQVADVLKRYFEGMQNLCRLEIETDELTSPFYYEWSPTIANTFPHIYGIINLDAIKNVQVVR